MDEYIIERGARVTILQIDAFTADFSGAHDRAAALDAGVDEWADVDALVGLGVGAHPSARAAAVTITPLACPLVWAKEANAYCCVRFFPHFPSPALFSSLSSPPSPRV